MTATSSDAELLSLENALSLLKIGKTKFYQCIDDGIFPKPLKIGRRSLWRATDLKAAIDRLGDSHK